MSRWHVHEFTGDLYTLILCHLGIRPICQDLQTHPRKYTVVYKNMSDAVGVMYYLFTYQHLKTICSKNSSRNMDNFLPDFSLHNDPATLNGSVHLMHYLSTHTEADKLGNPL